MRRILFALLTSTLLVLPAGPAHAQGGGQLLEGLSNCLEYAGQAALPSLAAAQAFTPNGYGPYGWGPLSQPFGAGPIGPATMYSPPGLVPAYGPLGPGLTAANIAQFAIPSGGFGFNNTNVNNFLNTTTLLGLAGLQQGELGTLYGRYGLAGTYQTAAGTWAAGLSARAGSTLAVALALCLGQPRPQATSTSTSTSTMPTAMPLGTMPGTMPLGALPGSMPPGMMPSPMMPGTMPSTSSGSGN